jgi:outer membrane protein insertion porin family
MMKKILQIIIFSCISLYLNAQHSSNQTVIDYSNPKEYEIGGVTISGIQYLDHNVLLYLTGLEIGNKITIPGDDITKAIKILWEQGLFSDVKISMTRQINDVVFLDIYLEERPRLSKFSFTGVKNVCTYLHRPYSKSLQQ